MKKRLNATSIKEYVGKEIFLETTEAGNAIQTETGSWFIPIDRFKTAVTLIEIAETLPKGQPTKLKVNIDGNEAIISLNHFSGVFVEE